MSSLDSTPALDMQALQRHINLLNRKVAILEQENRHREQQLWNVYYIIAAYAGLKMARFLWSKFWDSESIHVINKIGCFLHNYMTKSTLSGALGCFLISYNVRTLYCRFRKIWCFLLNFLMKCTTFRKRLL